MASKELIGDFFTTVYTRPNYVLIAQQQDGKEVVHGYSDALWNRIVAAVTECQSKDAATAEKLRK